MREWDHKLPSAENRHNRTTPSLFLHTPTRGTRAMPAVRLWAAFSLLYIVADCAAKIRLWSVDNNESHDKRGK